MIGIWPAAAPGADPQAHFWFRALDTTYRRICDSGRWPAREPLRSATTRSRMRSSCPDCRELYALDIVSGEFRLEVIDEPPD